MSKQSQLISHSCECCQNHKLQILFGNLCCGSVEQEYGVWFQYKATREDCWE